MPPDLFSGCSDNRIVSVCAAVLLLIVSQFCCVHRHVFRPDCLPQKRFLVYQLCDLEEESLQQLVHCNDGLEPATCNVGIL